MKKLAIASVVLGLLLAAAPAFAETRSSEKVSKSVDLSCMQTAVETRDNAIIGAWDGLHEAMVDALEARRDALKAAWKLEERKERNEAIKTAWKEFRADRKEAHADFNKARKSAWKEFRTDVKECRGITDTGSEKESDDNL